MVKTSSRKVADIVTLNGTTFFNVSDVVGRIASGSPVSPPMEKMTKNPRA